MRVGIVFLLISSLFIDISYQFWVNESVSNNFMLDHAAEVTQQVEPGSTACRTGPQGGSLSGGALLPKGQTKLWDEDSPAFMAQRQQILNWEWETKFKSQRIRKTVGGHSQDKRCLTRIRRHTKTGMINLSGVGLELNKKRKHQLQKTR